MNTPSFDSNQPPIDPKWMKVTEKGIEIGYQSKSYRWLTKAGFGCFGLVATGVAIFFAATDSPFVILGLLPIGLFLRFMWRLTFRSNAVINLVDQTIELQVTPWSRSRHAIRDITGYSIGQRVVTVVRDQNSMPTSRSESGMPLLVHFRDGSTGTAAQSFNHAELTRLADSMQQLFEWAGFHNS